MNVLVTGGAGFIGSHIVDMLISEGHNVSIIDNLSHGNISNINKKATFYQFDICDKSIATVFEKEKPEIVIHEAAQIKVPKSVEDPIHDANVNIIGSINILECCKNFNVKKIIYPASAAIFGEPKYLPIDENHPLDMISGYGVSKHTVEHYLKIYKTLYDIDYTILRYSNVYGPRQDSSGEGGVVAIFTEQLLNDMIPTIFGDGSSTRDFVYVKDVAKANILAMNSDKIGIYNVCTNLKISINDLFNKMNTIMNKSILPIYATERKGDIAHSYMSYDKISKEIGWRPEYTLDKGLIETLKYSIDSTK